MSVLTRRRCLAALVGFPAIVRSAAANVAPLDDAMRGLLDRHDIPGAVLGIARNGQTAFVHGYGVASLARGEAVEPESRFRLASVTKPVTAMAVLRLCEQGKLTLDEPVIRRLKLQPLSGQFSDERWSQITVRHLLQHTGGWNKARSGDPMFQSRQICREAGVKGPASAELTVRWMMTRTLDHEPGTRYAYSNFGYCVLGRLIEAVTGSSYGSAIRRLISSPVGASGLEMGSSLSAKPGEVTYHQGGTTESVFPQLGEQAAWPYGAFSLEANDANGGLIASAGDMLRFLTALDDGARKPLLNRATLAAAVESAAPGFGNASLHHGLGWLVRPNGQAGRPNLWYLGSLPGTKAVMVRLGDGFDWIALFNGGQTDPDDFATEVQNTVHRAARDVVWG